MVFRRPNERALLKKEAAVLVVLVFAVVASSGASFTGAVTHTDTNLEILTSSRNALVYVDGTYVGTSPVGVFASSGAHQVTVRKSGYITQHKIVTVPAGGEVRTLVQLSPIERSTR